MKETLNTMKEKMTKSINALANELATIRAGRANPAVLDKVLVDYWGTPTPIQQMAAVSVSEGRILVISPWEKNQLKPIEKAIQESDLGVMPSNDGSVIRLPFPEDEFDLAEMTEDIRPRLISRTETPLSLRQSRIWTSGKV